MGDMPAGESSETWPFGTKDESFLCLGLAKGKFEYKLSITCTIVVGWYVGGGDGRCWFVISSDGGRVVLSSVGRVHGWRVTIFVTQRDVCRGGGGFWIWGIGSHPLGLYRRPELRFDLKPAQGPSNILTHTQSLAQAPPCR